MCLEKARGSRIDIQLVQLGTKLPERQAVPIFRYISGKKNLLNTLDDAKIGRVKATFESLRVKLSSHSILGIDDILLTFTKTGNFTVGDKLMKSGYRGIRMCMVVEWQY